MSETTTAEFFSSLNNKNDRSNIFIPFGDSEFMVDELQALPQLTELQPFLNRVYGGRVFSRDFNLIEPVKTPTEVELIETIYRSLLYTTVCRLEKFNFGSPLAIAVSERLVINEWSNALHVANVRSNPDMAKNMSRFGRFCWSLQLGVRTPVLNDCLEILPIKAAEMRRELDAEEIRNQLFSNEILIEG